MEPSLPSVLPVEYLVAMIRATGGHTPLTDERHLFKQVGFLSLTPERGISPDIAANNHFCRVLDALASLCVSRGSHQVISIGLQIDHRTSCLTITIADTGAIHSDTVTYLTDIWAIMKHLSDLYAASRSSSWHPSGVPWNHLVGDSPDIPRSRQITFLFETLIERVYGFTRAKLMKRIRKWWDPPAGSGLLDFGRAFETAKGSNLEGRERKLHKLLYVFRKVVQSLRGHNVDWQLVLAGMSGVVDISNVLLKEDPKWCDHLALELSSEEKPTFPLQRAIEKLTSHHRYFLELISFANSPRLRLAFSLSISVETAPVLNPPGTVQLPSSLDGWRLVLQQLCARHNYKLRPERTTLILEQLLTCPMAPSEHHIHSECSLVAYYETLRTGPDRYVPAFSYIGVSKLSCKPCRIWLDNFNSRGTGYPKFYTRGSHGKWYHPWTAPTFAGWDLGLVDLLESEFVTFLNWRGITRSASDSTVASEEPRFEQDEAEEDKFMSMIEEGMNEGFL